MVGVGTEVLEKVQIAKLCWLPHLLKKYFTLQDPTKLPVSKHTKNKRFYLTIFFLAVR